MKIVDLKTFRALPEGTIAAKYEPCVFGDLFVKGETWEVDFILAYLTNEIDASSSDDMMDKMDRAEAGEAVPMSFEEYMRDGLFEDGQLFAVWEKADVEGLIAKLTTCLEAYS